jgi:hypothetical protein
LFYLADYDPAFKKRCCSSLEAALIELKFDFSDELIPVTANWIDTAASKDETCKILEMSQEDRKILLESKQHTSKGYYGPLVVEKHPDSKVGYIVKAIKPIKKGTLICEYAGELFKENDPKVLPENDSVMNLIHKKKKKVGTIIAPQKTANLARFISGINDSHVFILYYYI